ncbi:MAG: hypothetical protein ABI616_00400 [Pseudomonadota bacterium]
MNSRIMKASMLKTGMAAGLLLLAGEALAASTVTLAAKPTRTALPDGQSVPMWGYACGTGAAAAINATCTAANGAPQTGVTPTSGWQPPVITVPKGSLTINLINNLSFQHGNSAFTSLVIVGQLGGGLGSAPVRMAPVTHAKQGTTWPGTLGTTGPDDTVFTPPAQVGRVRSFGMEVAPGATTALVWNDLSPGTYLIESGTEPSIQGAMGLYGVLVVTDTGVNSGKAWGQAYDKDAALLFSEIDPVQNTAVDIAVNTSGFDEKKVWNGQPTQCGDASVHSCYPPVVNYDPRYYLINGVSFDRSKLNLSTLSLLAPVSPATTTTSTSGVVLLRLVNAGLRMHVPAVVGASLTLLAEDGNKLPGVPKVQDEVFLSAGKTYDVAIKPALNAGKYVPHTFPVFDRALNLSTNNSRDGGMQAFISIGGGAAAGAVGSSASANSANAVADSYNVVSGKTLNISDPAKGLIANDSGIYGVAVVGAMPAGLVLNSNGTFTYAGAPTSFNYCGNGVTAFAAPACATVTLAACSGACLGGLPLAGNGSYTSTVASQLKIAPPGVLAFATSPGALSLTVSDFDKGTCGSVNLNPDGSFAATPGATPSACSFTYNVASSSGQASAAPGTISVNFLAGNGMTFTVKDAKTGVAVTDYRWIIEEDRTFWIDPKCQVNVSPRPAGCLPLPVESLGYSFHTANMPVIAEGCQGSVSCETGQTLGGAAAVCDVGNGGCRTDSGSKIAINPGDVNLDPTKRYFISVLPGDGVNPVVGGAGGPDDNGKPFTIAAACGTYTGPTGAWEPAGAGAICGHAMGGVQISTEQVAAKSPITVVLQETPLPTAKLSVFVFQDDFPLNGENDAGGGVDVLAPNEPGLGGFEIKIFDQAGGLGDATGQVTYDQFNMPLSNSLANKMDPITGLDACPINTRGDGLVGMIPSCPKFESDGKTLSPLAGQVVVANLFPGIYEVTATPAADRIAHGEEWLQTNTLDGGKPHEAFLKPDEPGYFQEFGPGGFHVSIGFANPKTINDRKAAYCSSALNPSHTCDSSVTVQITNNHLSRTPDQRTFSSETYDHYGFTQCYVSIGEADAEDFAIEKCDADGKVTFSNMPNGVFKLAVFDQWNDIMLDGLVSTISVNGTTTKNFPVTQWRTNLYTRTFFDKNGNGVSDEGEAGLALVNTNIRYRDGSIGFFNNTDLDGYAGFNEVFPFMNWLVVDTTNTRFKSTGVHAVYDAGGQVDCSTPSPTTEVPCSQIAKNLANTSVRVALPAELRVPGAKYCDQADCPASDALGGKSTGAVFPAQAFGTTQGWQGLLGQDTFIEFGVRPFKTNENGGITGDVIYASTRPFDDPSLSLQLSWEPGVPRVTVNLYQKSVDSNGVDHLTLVDTTKTASWDDWAQGFRKDKNGNLMSYDGGNIPNMNCPGQSSDSPFFATLKDSKQWLDPSSPKKNLSAHSQFKCYDGWSQLNQVQPAPYDGRYVFPSMTKVNEATGKSAGTNCSICSAKKDADGNPMLPPGTYVVEVILPQGYELVKEEDKNILLGDVFVAPVTQQFAGLGSIFIMPDQAAVSEHYNSNSPGALDLTNNLGANPRHEGDTGSIESFWPCVGTLRTVPDLNSLFPDAGQAAPFAGAERRLCDRKEVVLEDQATVLAKFFVFSSTHIAGHFTGLITNDFAAEFDPFSPQFGEKFGPPNLPVAMRDFTGNEVARVYSDQWGVYNGLYYSSYSVNPPNPTGYVPQMSIACMNDPGQAVAADGTPIVDPAYNPAYSDFCYETPFMPGFTAYMDTPVIPTQSFADGYNLPDAEYPDGTPAIKKVVNSNASAPQGPWVKPGNPATSANVKIAIDGVNRCRSGNASRCSTPSSIGSVTVGATLVTTGAITCTQSESNPDCSPTSQSIRNNNMAQSLTDAINAHSGISGYTATRSNAIVTVTANATGALLNGTAVSVNTTNMTSPGLLALGGGAASSGGNMGITITALGQKVVQNPNFSGPNATTAPWNQKTITRTYDFGSSAGTAALVGSDGVVRPLTGVIWSTNTITGTVPDGLPNCGVAQRGQPDGQAAAKCGELVITKADGKQSIDAITVTVGGSAPWIVTPTSVVPPSGTAKTTKDYTSDFGRLGFSPIQTAIDSADPGDLILVMPGAYRENLLMWKPVRLQGVGAASVTVNADAHPAGKMDQWRRQVNCTFGLNLDGIPDRSNTGFDSADTYTCPAPMHQRVDRIPFEAIIGWDAAGNGNLAQVLQEPTLMGAYEGAGITVLGRGIRIPNNSTDFWGANSTGGAGAFADGSVYLDNGNADCTINNSTTGNNRGRDYGTSNFFCNPSRIDGISVVNSSQGGGGLFIHGWAHNLDVANTRISGNHGTLAGAINLGNGEIPDAFINDGVECGVNPPGTLVCPPIPNGTPTNGAIPFQFNVGVRIHHNMLYDNASIGDALFSGTPAGAGAITVSSGADGYQIDHNWIAGNLSTGDGGGLQHLGLSFNGKINNNYILFNQSTNPTLPTNGGGVVIEGANLDRQLNGQECGSTSDQDCPPGLGEGTGAGLVLDANLILGNSAESGSGGGVRIQQVNGSELVAFPGQQGRWYDLTVTNNIIANNVAGWDGGGVSMQDAFKVTLANNTIASNDTTASAGVLFKTLGAIYSATPPPGCTPTTDPTLPQNPNCTQDNAQHGPQPSGLVVMANTPNLADAMNDLALVMCPPTGFGYSGGILGINGDCRKLSKPSMSNNLFFHNRSFSVDIVGAGTGLQSQQNLIALAPALDQATTAECAAPPVGIRANFYWDVGLRTDDLTSGLIPAGTKLTMDHSILSGDPQNVIVATANRPVTPDSLVAPFCNGARVAPENGGHGYQAPPGASETTSLAQVFVFDGIQPTATVDEGHNWLNLSYGPLTLNRAVWTNQTGANAPELMVAGSGAGTAGGAYSIPGTSPAVNSGTNSGLPATTAHDFFGNTRARSNANPADIGAVECQVNCTGSVVISVGVAPATLAYGNVIQNSASAVKNVTLTNNGNGPMTGITLTFTGPYTRSGGSCPAAPFQLAAGQNCTVGVVFQPTVLGSVSGTLAVAGSGTVTGSPVALTGTGVAIPTRPALGVLDNFNRTNASNLGLTPTGATNWSQPLSGVNAALKVSSSPTNQALCTPAPGFAGLLFNCTLNGAMWNGAGNVFGNRQAAAFTVTSGIAGDRLILKGTGGSSNAPQNYVRIELTGNSVTVATTTTMGLTTASSTTITNGNSTFASGDVLTALVDASGLTTVWKNSTYVGSVALPSDALWTTGGGRIGMQIPNNQRVDNFAGGTVP